MYYKEQCIEIVSKCNCSKCKILNYQYTLMLKQSFPRKIRQRSKRLIDILIEEIINHVLSRHIELVNIRPI